MTIQQHEVIINQAGGCQSQDQPKQDFIDNGVGLVDVGIILLAGKVRIAIMTIGCMLVAAAIAFLITPVYRAEVLMMPVTNTQDDAMSGISGQFGGIASFAGISLGEKGGGKEEAIAILRSRILSDLYIRENNLLPVLFENNWNADQGKWKTNNPDKIPTLWDAFKLMENRIRKVVVDKKTGLVTLSIEWKNPDQAAGWAEGMVNRANLYLRERAVRHAEDNLAYLQEQARKNISLELQQAIFHLMESEIKKAMIANVNKEYAFKIIDPAVVPEEKARPDRLKMILFGGGVGFFLAGASLLVSKRI